MKPTLPSSSPNPSSPNTSTKPNVYSHQHLPTALSSTSSSSTTSAPQTSVTPSDTPAKQTTSDHMTSATANSGVGNTTTSDIPPLTAGNPPTSSNMGSALKGKLSAIDMRTLSCMVLNFFSSTSLVVMNKIAMDKYGFKFATTLTCFHLICTFSLLLIASKLGIYEIKKLPVGDVSKLAAGTMGFICFTNLSLQHNSIGFYQVMKVMTTPTVVIIESLFYQKYLENNLKISLIPVCLGVIITVATDFRLNLIGTGYAVAGVIVTSLYQIWSGTLQRSLDCNGLQLQTYVSPLAAAFVIPFIPLLDNYSPNDPKSIWFYKFAADNTPIIAMTGFFGFLVNISIFLVIGRSSPLSYNILGHCKTVVVLLSDYILFGRPATFKSSFGIILTLAGVFWYTSLKLEKARVEKEARERTPTNAKAKDVLADKEHANQESVRLMDSRKE